MCYLAIFARSASEGVEISKRYPEIRGCLPPLNVGCARLPTPPRGLPVTVPNVDRCWSNGTSVDRDPSEKLGLSRLTLQGHSMSSDTRLLPFPRYSGILVENCEFSEPTFTETA